jgi:hypothetical protein
MTARRLAAVLMMGVILGIAAIGMLRTDTLAWAGGSPSAFARD